jgi:hypothetical protein
MTKLPFFKIMFSRAIWGSWLFVLLYAIVAYSYATTPEFTWLRLGVQAGALLIIAFIFTLIGCFVHFGGKRRQA